VRSPTIQLAPSTHCTLATALDAEAATVVTLDVRQGGGAALIAKEGHVSQGAVGVLIAGRATIAPGARVLLRATPAVAFAAVAAFAAGGCLDSVDGEGS